MRKEQVKDKKSFLTNSLELLITALISVIIVLIVTLFVQIGKVSGESMRETYQDGNIVFIQKLFVTYKRDDIIVFKYNEEHENYYETVFADSNYNVTDTSDMKNELHVKRIVGVPGDVVKILNNSLYVNDEKISDSVMEIPYQYYTLTEGQYFVAGDNHDNSFDSRQHGPITIDDLYGKIITNK